MSRAEIRLAHLVKTDPAAALRAAERIEAQERARSARVATKKKPGRERRQAEAARQEERHRYLVSQVLLRAEGRCELCGDAAGGLEPHHLELGAGKTRNEKLSNVIAACRADHDAAQMNERRFVPTVLAWCQRYGYPVPRRRVYREARTA